MRFPGCETAESIFWVKTCAQYIRTVVVAAVKAMGDGLYIVGLDYHVGFLRVTDGQVRFIHASWYKRKVVNESAEKSIDIQSSRDRVVGKVLQSAMQKAWLNRSKIKVLGNW